jgi:hypothetical protein
MFEVSAFAKPAFVPQSPDYGESRGYSEILRERAA